jgi:Ca2+-binding EF-hand superfamily protein
VDANGFIAFNHLDSDRNGYVSRVEARSVKGVETVFDSADTNSDGLLDHSEYTSVRPARKAE